MKKERLTLWCEPGSRDCEIGTLEGDMISHDVVDISQIDKHLDWWEDKGFDVEPAREAAENIREGLEVK